MPLALTGSLTAVQFCYPAELPLILNKLKRFETGSLDFKLYSFGSVIPVTTQLNFFQEKLKVFFP